MGLTMRWCRLCATLFGTLAVRGLVGRGLADRLTLLRAGYAEKGWRRLISAYDQLGRRQGGEI